MRCWRGSIFMLYPIFALLYAFHNDCMSILHRPTTNFTHLVFNRGIMLKALKCQTYGNLKNISETTLYFHFECKEGQLQQTPLINKHRQISFKPQRRSCDELLPQPQSHLYALEAATEAKLPHTPSVHSARFTSLYGGSLLSWVRGFCKAVLVCNARKAGEKSFKRNCYLLTPSGELTIFFLRPKHPFCIDQYDSRQFDLFKGSKYFSAWRQSRFFSVGRSAKASKCSCMLSEAVTRNSTPSISLHFVNQKYFALPWSFQCSNSHGHGPDHANTRLNPLLLPKVRRGGFALSGLKMSRYRGGTKSVRGQKVANASSFTGDYDEIVPTSSPIPLLCDENEIRAFWFSEVDSTQKWAIRCLNGINENSCEDDGKVQIESEVAKMFSATEEEKKWVCISAGRQLSGVGTRHFNGYGSLEERKWKSPLGNLYVTYIIPWSLKKMSDVILVPHAVILSVCRVLEKSIGIRPRVKWVNDALVEDRKICGVLSTWLPLPSARSFDDNSIYTNSSQYSFQSRTRDHEGVLVVGIGLNVLTTPDSSNMHSACVGFSSVSDCLRMRTESQGGNITGKFLQRTCMNYSNYSEVFSNQSPMKTHGGESNFILDILSDAEKLERRNQTRDCGFNNIEREDDLYYKNPIGCVNALRCLLDRELHVQLSNLCTNGFEQIRKQIVDRLAWKGERVKLIIEDDACVTHQNSFPSRHNQAGRPNGSSGYSVASIPGIVQGNENFFVYEGVLVGLNSEGGIIIRGDDGVARTFTTGRLLKNTVEQDK